MFLSITTIPHEKQRYPSCGDYFTIKPADDYTAAIYPEVVKFNISETGNDDYNFLIAIHELVEWYLCKKAGISEKVIDDWDLSHPESNDPGSLEGCPYKKQHEEATATEGGVASALGMNSWAWSDYESALEKLMEGK